MTKSNITRLALACILLSALSSVSAHGYLRQIAIDGQIYRGNIPNVSNFTSPIRAVDDIVPVKGTTNRDLNCGIRAPISSFVAPAKAGSTLTFDWAGGDNGLWPHNTGPMLTYMAKCGNTTCDKFDAINAMWFKIDEAGKKNDTAWFQGDIMIGNTYSTQIPLNIAPGDYLVRHEIIALQLATVEGGVEFYPSCSQIRISSNGTGEPQSTVAFPGGYSATEPGILDPDVFNPGAPYTFPGPNIDPNVHSGSVAITSPAPSTTGLPDPSFTPTPPLSSSFSSVAASVTSSTTASATGASSSSSADPCPMMSTTSASSSASNAITSSMATSSLTLSMSSASSEATTSSPLILIPAPEVRTTIISPEAASSLLAVAAAQATPATSNDSGTGSTHYGTDPGYGSGYSYKPRGYSRVMARHFESIQLR